MRINQFIARATGFSRRHSDNLIASGRVFINNRTASLGETVKSGDNIRLGRQPLKIKADQLVMLNKPAGYVCSKRSQGSKTIYELLPNSMSELFSIGRLDKPSSGLILLTNDGVLAQSLAHPKFQKIKSYEVGLDRILNEADRLKLLKGVRLEDGVSRFVSVVSKGSVITVELSEGRNRQIRRTFEELGYKVKKLHRTSFGPYRLGDLAPGRYKQLS